jgi:hypothetical protein
LLELLEEGFGFIVVMRFHAFEMRQLGENIEVNVLRESVGDGRREEG